MTVICTQVEVDVLLDDFESEDLIDEVRNRGYTVDADLDDFETEDLVTELEARGYSVTYHPKKKVTRAPEVEIPSIHPEDMEYLEHLVCCGMRQAAAEEALDILRKIFNRPLG